MSYFCRGTVVRDLQTQDKFRAIEEILNKADVFSCVKDKRVLRNDIFRREEQQNTGFGHGVAVAHGISDVPDITIALGISKKGIHYGSPDGNPVNLLFVIASPNYYWDVYLCSLSALVKLLRIKEFRESLLQASSDTEAEDILSKAISAQLKMETSPITKGK